MLQTIYEGDSYFSSDSFGKLRMPQEPHDSDMHNVNNSGDSWFSLSLSLSLWNARTLHFYSSC